MIQRWSCLILLVLYAGCTQAGPAQNGPPPKVDAPPIEASTMPVELIDWPVIIRSQGSLYPEEEAQLGMKVEGRVETVHVDLGDVVEANAPLVTLAQNDFQFRVSQAEAQLLQARSAVGLKPGDPIENLQPLNAPPVREQQALWNEAKANLERAADLLARNAILKAEYEQVASAERVAAARYDSSINSVREKIANISVQQALLDLAKENLEDSVLKAPFAGIIQQRRVAPGSYVKVGDPLIELVRVETLRYRGTVPERVSSQIAIGQEVTITIERSDIKHNTEVARISPFLDLMSRALTFEAMVENSQLQLRAGLFAEAEIIVDANARTIAIPLKAVTQFAGTEKVWKVSDGVVSEQVVLLGERRDGMVQILEGLAYGDTILTDAEKGRPGKLKAEVVESLKISEPTSSIGQ